MTIPETLRFLRLLHDIDLGRFSKEIGISSAYLSEIENGKKKPSLEIIEKYANRFYICTSDLFLISEKCDTTKEFKKFALNSILKCIKGE